MLGIEAEGYMCTCTITNMYHFPLNNLLEGRLTSVRYYKLYGRQAIMEKQTALCNIRANALINYYTPDNNKLCLKVPRSLRVRIRPGIKEIVIFNCFPNVRSVIATDFSAFLRR